MSVERATILRRGTKDKFGDAVDGVELRIEGCLFAPQGSAETRNYSNTVITGFTMFAPHGTPIHTTDRIRRDSTGDIFEVNGEPATWENPFSHTSWGVQVALTRTRG